MGVIVMRVMVETSADVMADVSNLSSFFPIPFMWT